MSSPTLNQVYHAYMDTERDGRNVIEIPGINIDHIYCDMITTILEIPGVREAVIVAALKNDYYLNEFSPATVDDIPFQFVWDFIMNPAELGLEEPSS